MAMEIRTTMSGSSTLPVGNYDGGNTNVNFGGKAVIKPKYGFAKAYRIGHPCWPQNNPYIFISYCADLRDIPPVEGFGPDENGNLISLGKLAPGWQIMSGNPGGIVTKNSKI